MSAGDSRLTRKVVLVTGSSSGAGAQIAREFACLGAHVAVHCRSNLAAAQEVVEAIRQDGHRAAAFRADLGIAAESRRLARFFPQSYTPGHIMPVAERATFPEFRYTVDLRLADKAKAGHP